jgi:hypothetical protein
VKILLLTLLITASAFAGPAKIHISKELNHYLVSVEQTTAMAEKNDVTSFYDLIKIDAPEPNYAEKNFATADQSFSFKCSKAFSDEENWLEGKCTFLLKANSPEYLVTYVAINPRVLFVQFKSKHSAELFSLFPESPFGGGVRVEINHKINLNGNAKSFIFGAIE